MRILIEGSIEGSYSLSIVNRCFGRALIELGHDIWFYKPGASLSDLPFLAKSDPDIASRYFDKRQGVDIPFDVHSKNDYPLNSDGLVGRVNAVHCFGWEETLFPEKLINSLSQFQVITFMSTFCLESARRSGLSRPKAVIGLGLEHLPAPSPGQFNRKVGERPFTFLHISSGLKRKGMEKGLIAFVEEFITDDVRLVIKTYPNVTNEIPCLLEQLGDNEILSRIEVLESPMSPEEIASLIDEADAMFLPSYGEGFLLPAAEAMMHGTLVVTTDCGGNRDFCTDDTCLLVPTKLRRTQSHVGRASAFWFEPELSDLRAALRRAVAMLAADRMTMLACARKAVERYTWTKCAQAFVAIAEQTLMENDGGAKSQSSRALVLLSTFRQRCGLATYSEQLVEAAVTAGVRLTVYTENLGDTVLPQNDGVDVRRVWRRHRDSLVQAAELISRDNPGEPVIIQFHAAIISWQVLRQIIAVLKRCDHIVIVEVHSLNGLSEDILPSEILFQADHIIVHNDHDFAGIAEGVIASKVSLFTHPVPSCPHVVHSDEFDDRTLLTTFGICGRHKRFELVLQIVAELRHRGHDVRAKIISGVDKNKTESLQYVHDLCRLRSRLGLDNSVDIITSFLPMFDIETALRSSRLAVFPYSNVSEGASGAVRVAISVDVPVITSRSTIFADLAILGCQYGFDETDVVTDVVERYIFDDNFREEALLKQQIFKGRASWAQHVQLIEELVAQ